MADLGFQAFDSDHHYYEAEDAFTRHVDPRMQSRCMQWAEVNGRKRLLVGGKVNRFIPNPTFDPVAQPGILDEYFRGKNPEGKSVPELFGRLDPISPAYRDRDARVKQLDEQGIGGAMFFPTLGVGMQESLRHDPEAACIAFEAFNKWMEEDWGFHYQDRLYAAPYISLMDPAWAERELERVLARGARVVSMVPGPVPTGPETSVSIGLARFDGFWARVAEAGITVAFHSGDAGYRRFTEAWGGEREFRAFSWDPLAVCLSPEPIHDTLAALICHGVFQRHPRARVATIECGSAWAPALVRKLKKAYGQMPYAFERDPIEQLREHVKVAPYYEDDIAGLRELIGTENVLFGSDFPHAEGLAVPTDFVNDLEGFGSDEVELIMRDNGWKLVQPI
jgi:predicted TIM-barrel fold metal-dependent hydrolase